MYVMLKPIGILMDLFDITKYKLLRIVFYFFSYNYLLIPNDFFGGMLALAILYEIGLIIIDYFRYFVTHSK